MATIGTGGVLVAGIANIANMKCCCPAEAGCNICGLNQYSGRDVVADFTGFNNNISSLYDADRIALFQLATPNLYPSLNGMTIGLQSPIYDSLTPSSIWRSKTLLRSYINPASVPSDPSYSIAYNVFNSVDISPYTGGYDLSMHTTPPSGGHVDIKVFEQFDFSMTCPFLDTPTLTMKTTLICQWSLAAFISVFNNVLSPNGSVVYQIAYSRYTTKKINISDIVCSPFGATIDLSTSDSAGSVKAEFYTNYSDGTLGGTASSYFYYTITPTTLISDTFGGSVVLS